MAGFDPFTAGWALSISARLADVNPKNLSLTLAGLVG
jgi:hypothetical protein